MNCVQSTYRSHLRPLQRNKKKVEPLCCKHVKQVANRTLARRWGGVEGVGEGKVNHAIVAFSALYLAHGATTPSPQCTAADIGVLLSPSPTLQSVMSCPLCVGTVALKAVGHSRGKQNIWTLELPVDRKMTRREAGRRLAYSE